MFRRNFYIPALLIVCALMVAGLVLGGQAPTQARTIDANVAAQSGPKGDLPDFLQNMPADMRLNHG